jgi:hypothetical protein
MTFHAREMLHVTFGSAFVQFGVELKRNVNESGRTKIALLGVSAHCTHLRGSGVMENGIEKPNVRVTLASKLPAEDCAQLNLGYLDPAKISVDEWNDREDEGVLYVPKAGEILYRPR